MHVESLDHLHIDAADPEASAHFYQRHFDARKVHRNTNLNGDIRLFPALGEQIVVVGSFPADMTPTTPSDPGDGAFVHGLGVAHFGLRVSDVKAAIEELSMSQLRILASLARKPRDSSMPMSRHRMGS